MEFNSPVGIGEHYTSAAVTSPIDRLGNLLLPMRLSGFELHPQLLIVRFPSKALRALRMLPIPDGSEWLGRFG